MTYPLIKISRLATGIALLTLNRPEKRNALNIELMDQFCSAMEDLSKAGDCRVVIINAEGNVFCSGLDLNEAVDPRLIERSASHVSKMLNTAYHYPLVTIVALEGDVYAGGAGLVAACDLVVASEDAKIGFPEVRRGLVPAQIMAVLVRLLRRKELNELLLTGEPIPAQRALEMGLVNKIAPKEETLSAAIELASLVLKGAPEAVKQTKRLIQILLPGFSEDLIKAFGFHEHARHSPEAKEGADAFLNKRLPSWTVSSTEVSGGAL